MYKEIERIMLTAFLVLLMAGLSFYDRRIIQSQMTAKDGAGQGQRKETHAGTDSENTIDQYLELGG